MTVYVDELFLENFIMNYLILYMTAYFTKPKTKWLRLMLGAGVGATYVIVSVILQIHIYQEIFYKVILSVLIIIVTFSYNNIICYIKSIMVFYLITFAVGGASLGLAYFFNLPAVTYNGVFYIEEFPLQVIAVSLIMVLIFTRFLLSFWKSRMNTEALTYELKIAVLDKNINVNAFFDTGHNVYEPLSKFPVIFADIEAICNLFPEDVYYKFKNFDYNFSSLEWKSRIRFIPFSTVKQESNILMGFRPDEVVLKKKDEEIILSKVVIAVCDRRLCSSGAYQALIGNNIIEI